MENLQMNKEMVEKLKRKGLVACDIAISSAMKQMADPATAKVAVGIGLYQGLKYRGNFKRGLKAGLVTYGVMAGFNAIGNVAEKWDDIKRS